mmetsp:Transcript_33617/g.77562  ORF Transcript_33617/g.77562 Transcript_33617/m.77562 type:complete len:324 (-) Transcript_33617:1099-2070(-)
MANQIQEDKSHILVSRGPRLLAKWIDNDPSTFQNVVYEKIEGGKIASITLNRPGKRNAWTEFMRQEVVACLDIASRDKEVRVVLITGAGKYFCAGADLTPAGSHNPTSIEGDVPHGRNADNTYWRDGGGIAGLAVIRCCKPVVCAINGAAVGVGMTLPLCCDVTVAYADAKVGFVFGRRGLTMECLSSYFLERTVGHKIAMELVLTGRVFKAADAPSGLFNHVVRKREEVVPKAVNICKEMILCSGMSNFINRNLILRNTNLSPEEAHLIESQSIYWVGSESDVQEGISSFLEKRQAKFPMDPFRDSPGWLPWWRTIETRAKL